jgi:hypothetical protein
MANEGSFKKGEKKRRQGERGPGKATKDAREAIGRFVEQGAPLMWGWLQKVAEGDLEHDLKPNPAKAIELVQALAEYHIPKLARTELAGDKENPVRTVIEWKE